MGTNSISQVTSRRASLDYLIDNGGVIHNAISTQVWSGEANVHVSIVNWIMNGNGNPPFFLDSQEVNSITARLETTFDVAKAYRLEKNLKKCFEGVKLAGKGFLVTETQIKQWFQSNPENQRFLKLYSSGENLTDFPDLKPKRWAIDFSNSSLEEASRYPELLTHLKNTVRIERQANREEKLRNVWWQFKRTCPSLHKNLENLEYFFVIPRVSKWFIPVKQPKNHLQSDSVFTIASNDFYLYGIISSQLHRDWVKSQCSTLEDRTRYTNTTCFETFPFLWNASEKLKNSVREIMRELETYRLEEMKSRQWGITQLYNEFFNEPASKLNQLHRKLDEAVCKVYAWKYNPEKNYNEELFYLNQHLFEQEKLTSVQAKITKQKKLRLGVPEPQRQRSKIAAHKLSHEISH